MVASVALWACLGALRVLYLIGRLSWHDAGNTATSTLLFPYLNALASCLDVPESPLTMSLLTWKHRIQFFETDVFGRRFEEGRLICDLDAAAVGLMIWSRTSGHQGRHQRQAMQGTVPEIAESFHEF